MDQHIIIMKWKEIDLCFSDFQTKVEKQKRLNDFFKPL